MGTLSCLPIVRRGQGVGRTGGTDWRLGTGPRRLWVTTSNDTLAALCLLSKRGFDFGVFVPAIEETRRLARHPERSPENGIPIR
jgi:hypothetical protein